MQKLILILFIVVFSYGATAEHDALDILLQNKKLIQNKLNLNKPNELKKSESNMEDRMIDTMNSLFQRIQKPYSDKEAIDYIYSCYIRFFNFMVTKIGGTSKITDSINIQVLSNLLRSSENSEWARDKLINRTSFEALNANSVCIKKNLENSNLAGYKKYSLMRYLAIDNKERELMLNCPSFNLYEKASISDSLLDSLISLYKKEDTSQLKASYAGQLMKTGKKIAVKAALEGFCAPVYQITKFKTGTPCTTSTLQGGIVVLLSRYNSDVPEFDTTGTIRDYKNNPMLLEKRMAFWKTFRTWVLQNYNVNLQTAMPDGFFTVCTRSSIYR